MKVSSLVHLIGLGASLLFNMPAHIRADSPQTPATGFQEEVRVKAPTRIDWQFIGRDFGADPAADSYDSREQRYQLYVPENYNPRKAWPLVVFISPYPQADAWSYWEKPCKELGMLYCEAEDAGNDCHPARRTRIVLDMLDDARRRYQIDPDQTYLSGFSGGGRMTCLIGYALPEYFGGVAPICGTYPLPTTTYLRHRVRDRLSTAFVTGAADANRPENENYMAPLFKWSGVRSKLWVAAGMGHEIPEPGVLTEVLKWLARDLPRRRADAKARPSLAVAPSEAPARKVQAARYLEAAEAEAKQPERIWHAAALAQGVIDRWGRSPSAKSARRLVEDLRSDLRRAALLAEQRGSDEWREESARAIAREQFGAKTQACKDWQVLARKYAKTLEGRRAAEEVKRLEAVIAAMPKAPFLGIGFVGDTLQVGQLVGNGPAVKAGLQPGDVVAKFGGDEVETREEMTQALQERKPGDKVVMEVQRNGKSVTRTLQLGGRPMRDRGLPQGW